MRPLLASKPNQSVPVKSHLDLDKLCAFPVVKIRQKRWSGCATNFSQLKSDGKGKGDFCTTSTRCSVGASGLTQTSEQVEVNPDKNSKRKPQSKRVNVRSLALSLGNAKTVDDVAEVFKDYPDLPLAVYTTVIWGLGVNKRLDAAFAVFEWLKKNGTINVLLYNSLLSAVKINKKFGKVGAVIEDMKSRGFEPNIVTYNTLMSIRVEQGKPKEVFNLMSQVEDAGLSPDVGTYSIILRAYKEMEDAYGALDCFVKLREKYQKGELQRDYSEECWDKNFVNVEKCAVRIYLSLMRKWLARDENSTTKVLRFLSCMDKADIEMDQDFFQQLVWACTHEEHYMVVRELYKRLRESVPGDKLSVSVCNHIIWLMKKAKKWWAALEVYEEMLKKGPMPNNLSIELILSNFTILLEAARDRGFGKWALQLLDKMHEKGLTPDTKQWNCAIHACSRAGEVNGALKIFHQMVQKGVKPNRYSYVPLLSALEKGKLYDMAINLWNYMQKHGVKSNVHAYTILASVYAQKGDHDMVESVLEEMVAAGIDLTVITFNAIIAGCAKAQMGAAAYEWFLKMKGRNLKPDEASYEIVIGALTHDGKPRLAYQMYVRAYNEGLVLNTKAYNAVVEACQVGGVIADLDFLGFQPVDRKPAQIKK